MKFPENTNGLLAAYLLAGSPGPDAVAEAGVRATLAVAEQLADLTEQYRIGNVLAVAVATREDGPDPDPYLHRLALAEAGGPAVLNGLRLV